MKILAMVMANPTQITNVRAVPLNSGRAVAATSAENCGESAATELPQINKNVMKTTLELWINQGETKQHPPETKSEIKATLALPILFESHPPTIQPTPPAA